MLVRYDEFFLCVHLRSNSVLFQWNGFVNLHATTAE